MINIILITSIIAFFHDKYLLKTLIYISLTFVYFKFNIPMA